MITKDKKLVKKHRGHEEWANHLLKQLTELYSNDI
jgi:hypothetical protein